MRALAAISVGLAAGIFAFAAASGLLGSWPIALPIALLAAGLVAASFWRRPIVALDQGACSRGLQVVSGLATIVALVQLSRLAVFTVDPSRTGYSNVPSSEWERRHSCVSAYFVAAQAAGEAPNIYDASLYSLPETDPAAPRKSRMIGPFRIDVYEYPPPFLLLPRALGLVVPDFMRFRMLWFGLNGAVVLLAMLVVARSLGPKVGTRALLLTPLVWVALPTMSFLQKGNVQGVVIALSMLAMVLFERRRWAAGGALLAFATVSKLFPGMLLVYLVACRQWRALAWTGAFSLAFALAALVDVGWLPYAAFVAHLPGLVGGEAFPAFRVPAAVAINFSVPGLVFKLKLFGVPGMSFGAAKIVGWAYTIIAIAATIIAGRRAGHDHEKPLVWMAILILATLRSPFLPQAYAAFPPLWLLTLLAATYAPTARTLSLMLLGWLSLGVYWPLDWPMDPRLLAVIILVPQAATVALAVLSLRRASAAMSLAT